MLRDFHLNLPINFTLMNSALLNVSDLDVFITILLPRSWEYHVSYNQTYFLTKTLKNIKPSQQMFLVCLYYEL